jgi:uncharacterized membrane protein
MSDDPILVLTFVTALGCGLMSGVFFAFSAFIMTALGRVPAPQGIAVMQSINVFAVTPLFMTALFGTALACLGLIPATLYRSPPAAGYLLAGSTLYLIGTILVTIVFNVPRNNALARVDPESADGARVWADYVVSWTMWNHVRTLSGLAAAALLTWALMN